MIIIIIFRLKIEQKADKKSDKPSQTRELFKDGHSEMYIMDAKGNGNIGRYFNVSVSNTRYFSRS